jgi:hypothetical protein
MHVVFKVNREQFSIATPYQEQGPCHRQDVNGINGLQIFLGLSWV